MSVEHTEMYRKMVEMLRLLAAEAEIQRASLPQVMNVTDEIATLYDAVYRDVDTIYDRSLISREAKRTMDDIHIIFREMTRNYELWCLESLAADQEWKGLRMVARHLLTNMGERMQEPQLYWVSFIHGRY